MTTDVGVAVAVAELTDPKWIKQQLSEATHVLMHEEVILTVIVVVRV